MDTGSLQLILYRAYADTESTSAFVHTAVDSLNASGNCKYSLELSVPPIQFVAGSTELAHSYPLTTMGLFTGTLRSSDADLSPLLIKTVSELCTRRVSGSTRSHKQVAEAVMRILGITFHDVRNTLGSISGISQLLEMDAAGNEAVITGIKDIVGIVGKFDESATTVMRLLRGQELRYERQSFSLTDLCNSVLKRSARVYQLSSIALEKSIQDDMTCFGDEAIVKEIFLELLTNAASALEGVGGSIAVSVTAQGGKVEISVAQSGSPVPQEVQEYIFLPFFTTKEKGRGMGLTRIARYLKDWGGKIELSPTPEYPVRFVATLPITLP